jgi:hypothetical protein
MIWGTLILGHCRTLPNHVQQIQGNDGIWEAVSMNRWFDFNEHSSKIGMSRNIYGIPWWLPFDQKTETVQHLFSSEVNSIHLESKDGQWKQLWYLTKTVKNGEFWESNIRTSVRLDIFCVTFFVLLFFKLDIGHKHVLPQNGSAVLRFCGVVCNTGAQVVSQSC